MSIVYKDEIIDGQEITGMHTLKSWYDGDNLSIISGNKCYRINVGEILKFINGVKFKIVKKRKHKYLEMIDDGFEETRGIES